MAENFVGPVVITGDIGQTRSSPEQFTTFTTENISMTPFCTIFCPNGNLFGPFASVQSQTISVRDALVSGDLQLTGSDVAEEFDLAVGIDDAQQVSPGTVVVLDQAGALAPCTQAYRPLRGGCRLRCR